MTAPPKPRAPRRNALLEQLIQSYPVFRECKPLAIGIHKTLLAERPDIDKADLRTAMMLHTHSTAYLKVIVAGAARFDLTGAAAGMVTAEQQDQAVATLKERLRLAKERRKAEDEAKKRQEKLQQLAEKFSTH